MSSNKHIESGHRWSEDRAARSTAVAFYRVPQSPGVMAALAFQGSAEAQSTAAAPVGRVDTGDSFARQ